MKDKLKLFWSKWKILAKKAGEFQARVVLTVFYYIILTPFAFIFKLFSDPFNLKKNKDTNWHKKEVVENSIENARRQY